MQVPLVCVLFASLLSLPLVPTASHCSVNTCPPRVDGMSPAHLTSDTLMTLKEQQLSIAATQPPFPAREQLLTKDSISCAEKLFTDKLQRGWRISQWPPCLRLGWGPGELLSCQSEDWVVFCFVGCSVSPLRGHTRRESTISRGDARCPECLILLVSVFETSRVCGIHGFVAYCHGKRKCLTDARCLSCYYLHATRQMDCVSLSHSSFPNVACPELFQYATTERWLTRTISKEAVRSTAVLPIPPFNPSSAHAHISTVKKSLLLHTWTPRNTSYSQQKRQMPEAEGHQNPQFASNFFASTWDSCSLGNIKHLKVIFQVFVHPEVTWNFLTLSFLSDNYILLLDPQFPTSHCLAFFMDTQYHRISANPSFLPSFLSISFPSFARL